MIAKVTKGKSFSAFTRYLEAGRDGGDNPDRVASTRLLPGARRAIGASQDMLLESPLQLQSPEAWLRDADDAIRMSA